MAMAKLRVVCKIIIMCLRLSQMAMIIKKLYPDIIYIQCTATARRATASCMLREVCHSGHLPSH